MLQQGLKQKIVQKLSPQQIQLMQLFQVPTSMMEQRIKQELEANPALEEGADSTTQDLDQESHEDQDEVNMDDDGYQESELDAYINSYADDDPYSYNDFKSKQSQEEQRENILSVKGSFHDYLIRQLHMLELDDDRMIRIGEQIIGSIDDDGYLRRDDEAIMDDLLFTQNLVATSEEIATMIKHIHQFDPPGVGARNLQENLQLQLERNQADHDQAEKDALSIIKDHFSLFSRKHFEKLMERMDIDEERLKMAIDVIQSLNPRPTSGSDLTESEANVYVIPDFIIENKDNVLDLQLNGRNVPDLHVNRQYLNLLQEYRQKIRKRKPSEEDKSTIEFIRQKLDLAKWFIDAIRQRQVTLYNVMYAIMQLQKEYFITGDPLKIKPMVLKDVAELTNLDISTISRVINNKYAQTEFGTKHLKELFSEALQMPDGSEVSSLEIKNALRIIIDQEDKSNPYSDQQLQQLLAQQGYAIARRTVTKYREYLNKPVARLRRDLS